MFKNIFSSNILIAVKNCRLLSNTINMSTEAQPIIKKPRYDGRSKKRKWEERRSDKGANLYPEKKLCDENFVRVKRRKYAMLLGYCGADYFGMQRNPDRKTIEEELFNALLKADLITQDGYDQAQTIHFQRAARTDKGVSAARQVVSIKLPEEVNVDKINEHLPEKIKVFGVKRVTKGFNSKSQCSGRTYMYMLPTAAFAKSGDVSQETFRLNDELLSEINDTLKNFIGTKNFHNFTIKKSPNDPSAKRYMFSFECEAPFIRQGTEFVIMKVKGQSFMMHQIRKMVGLCLAITKGLISREILSKAWTMEKLNIPKAPGLGLVLEKVHYDKYNMKFGQDGLHESLDWTEADSDVEGFKEEHIFPVIINTEIDEQVLLNWIDGRLLNHDFYATETNKKDVNDAQSSDNEDEEEIDEQETNSNEPTDATSAV